MQQQKRSLALGFLAGALGDSPDEEHAVSAAMSNAIAVTTKVQGSLPLPIAFCCVGVEIRA